MSKAPGTAGTMPVTGAACGIKPSKEAMEVDFAIDFSQAQQFLHNSENEPQSTLEQNKPTNPSKD